MGKTWENAIGDFYGEKQVTYMKDDWQTWILDPPF
jgi:hypothetical protein